MTIDMPIRRLGADDAAVYREIRLEALDRHPAAFGATLEEEAEGGLAFFADRLANGAVFGAIEAGALAGIAGLYVIDSAKQRHKGNLWGVYVRPAARRRGLGMALVEAVLAHAVGRVELVQLHVTDPAAKRLYERCGFTVYGREPRALKVGESYADEILMWRPIGGK